LSNRAMIRRAFTHLTESGKANMVDIGHKAPTVRVARAQSLIKMSPETVKAIATSEHKKGDVLAVARIAGIQGAKATSSLIPLCHNIQIDKISVDFELDEESGIVTVNTLAKCRGETGIEMEALTAATIAALTVYDMCKAREQGIVIQATRLVEKRGGKNDYHVN